MHTGDAASRGGFSGAAGTITRQSPAGPPTACAAAYPPPARCSRPASRRSSPKHCVQQQFPIACRPAPAAPPPPPPPAPSASPGGAAASAPAGARQAATQGTKAAARHAGSGLARREGRARGRGIPGRQPSAWPTRHPPAPVTAPAAAGSPCRHAPLPLRGSPLDTLPAAPLPAAGACVISPSFRVGCVSLAGGAGWSSVFMYRVLNPDPGGRFACARRRSWLPRRCRPGRIPRGASNASPAFELCT